MNRYALLGLSLLSITAVGCLAPADAGPAPVNTKDVQTEVLDDDTFLTRVDARDDAAWRYFDFETRSEVDADTAGWDVAFLRFNIKTNDAVAMLAGTDFTTLRTAPADGYREDDPAPAPGDMETMPGYAFDEWYEYNMMTHVLSPRDAVYVVRSPEGNYFKVALQDYYDDAGTSGYVTLLWGSLDAPN